MEDPILLIFLIGFLLFELVLWLFFKRMRDDIRGLKDPQTAMLSKADIVAKQSDTFKGSRRFFVQCAYRDWKGQSFERSIYTSEEHWESLAEEGQIDVVYHKEKPSVAAFPGSIDDRLRAANLVAMVIPFSVVVTLVAFFFVFVLPTT